jgi:putative hydrolase of the HAD superfamily
MNGPALILDLDNTIFRTRSIDKKVFDPFFEHLAYGLKSTHDSRVIETIIKDLWDFSWDVVIERHKISAPLFYRSLDFLDNMKLELKISTDDDYAVLKSIDLPKFLVSTSLTSLQKAKIEALGIANDFQKIVINDTFKKPGNKKEIFKELVREFNLVPERTFVVGDNADSEIKAGNELGMVTIQILRYGVVKGDNAQYYVRSFGELPKILFVSK